MAMAACKCNHETKNPCQKVVTSLVILYEILCSSTLQFASLIHELTNAKLINYFTLFITFTLYARYIELVSN